MLRYWGVWAISKGLDRWMKDSHTRETHTRPRCRLWLKTSLSSWKLELRAGVSGGVVLEVMGFCTATQMWTICSQYVTEMGLEADVEWVSCSKFGSVPAGAFRCPHVPPFHKTYFLSMQRSHEQLSMWGAVDWIQKPGRGLGRFMHGSWEQSC